jgi:ATP-dependent Clp protease ATP-binding subunit ClpC
VYERFTDRAKRVMQLAEREALRFGHEFIDTEHVLLGLIAEGAGVGANVLLMMGLDLRKIRHAVEKLTEYVPGGEEIMGRLPHTPRTKKVLEYAHEEAREFEHHYVGTEHLLLGLVREQEGLAAQALTNLGLKLDDVRETVWNLLGRHVPMAPGAAPEVIVEPRGTSNPLLPSATTPAALTAVHLELVRDRIRRLAEQMQVFVTEQDYVLAARCRDEVEALTRLVAWYEWVRRPT